MHTHARRFTEFTTLDRRLRALAPLDRMLTDAGLTPPAKAMCNWRREARTRMETRAHGRTVSTHGRAQVIEERMGQLEAYVRR